MTVGMNGPSFLRPTSYGSLDAIRAAAQAQADAAAPKGGGLLDWVDRPAGVGTPAQNPSFSLPPQVQPANVVDSVKSGASRLWNWMTGWMNPSTPTYQQPTYQQPTYQQPTYPYPTYPQQPAYPQYPAYPSAPMAPPPPPPPPPPPAPVAPPTGYYPSYPAYPQQPAYPAYPQQPAYPTYPGQVPTPAYPQPNYQNDPQYQQMQQTLAQVRAMRQQIDGLLQQKPGAAPAPAPQAPSSPGDDAWAARLKSMKPAELAELGKTDKAAFFAALRPAAEAAEKKYGVPAAVILAQAALETGWGKHLAAGYNLFGHKGEGPAGSNTTRTREVENGRSIYINAKFAKYNNFFEGVEYHGKRYHNGYYDKAVNNYAKYKDPDRFARDITGIYATDPDYGAKLIQIMNQYKLK